MAIEMTRSFWEMACTWCGSKLLFIKWNDLDLGIKKFLGTLHPIPTSMNYDVFMTVKKSSVIEKNNNWFYCRLTRRKKAITRKWNLNIYLECLCSSTQCKYATIVKTITSIDQLNKGCFLETCFLFLCSKFRDRFILVVSPRK